MKKWKNVPFVSTSLVIINIIVFIACFFTGELLYARYGMDLWNVLVNREYERIFTALFLHADLSHLFNNMLLVFFLGGMIEKEIGHFRFGVAYFVSGICGALLSLAAKLLTGSRAMSIGASGAVFGLDGVLLALVLFSGKKMAAATPTRVILMIVLSLYSGFTTGNVDNAGHMGGLVSGFILGTILCLIDRFKNKQDEEVGNEY